MIVNPLVEHLQCDKMITLQNKSELLYILNLNLKGKIDIQQ